MKTILLACLGLVGICPIASAGTSILNPNRPYSFKLSSFETAGLGTTGLLLKVRVDGGPPLRLILDSGAEHLTLDRKAAARSGHTGGAPVVFMGAKGSLGAAFRTEAAIVQIEDLTLRDCEMVVAERKLIDGIDGAIPLSLFSSFLVHLDIPGRSLSLEPFDSASPSTRDFIQAVPQKHLLFFETQLRNGFTGYVLLDTGAAVNVISKSAATELQRAHWFTEVISLRAGMRALALAPSVEMDLSAMGRRHQLTLCGILGYPGLSGSVITVDYRDARVQIRPAR